MITIKELTVTYSKAPVLENLNLILIPGQIHGLISLNGSGKTTLLNTIYNLIKPDYGSVHINDQPTNKKLVSFLETQNYFYSNITGGEYLNLFMQSNLNFNLQEWQKLFKLPLVDLIENYSTGMKKKLALLAILKQNKPIIILDEPFNGLDLEASNILKLLLPLLKEKGKTVIITSHILEPLMTSCDYIHYLNNRKIKRTFSREEFSVINAILFEDTQQQITQLITNAI